MRLCIAACTLRVEEVDKADMVLLHQRALSLL